MAKPRIVLATVLVIFTACATLHADGIGSLIEVGKSMDAANKELAEETARFNSVKRAIESGVLKKGLSRQAVLSQYGEPVVMNEDTSTKRERWIYKPSSSSFFEGAKIYLFFDADALLAEIREE
jgi:hypothetical protein